MSAQASHIAPPAAPARASTRASALAVEVFGDLAAVQREWCAFEADAAMTVFQRHAWLDAWQATVGAARGSRPRVAVVRDRGGQPCMILPLALERRMGVPALVWMASAEADYHAPLLCPRFARRAGRVQMAEIFSRIADAVPEARLIDLGKTACHVAGVPNPLAALAHTPHPSAAHAIALGEDWEAFYASRRSKKTRRKDAQRLRRLESMGEFRFEIADTAPARHAMLDRLLAQKAAWLDARGIADPFGPEAVRAFLHRLVATPALADTLHVSAMTLDGEIVAGNLGYVHDGRFYAVIGSITDGDAARQSPGIFHMHALMKWCMDAGIGKFDLTVGDEGYKHDWCDMRLDLIDIRLPLSVVGTLALAPAVLGGVLKRRIKASPRLFAGASALRRLLHRMRAR